MELRIARHTLDAIEPELRPRAPWMHAYSLGEGVYVGYFKHHGIDDTVCDRSTPDDQRERFARAFDDYIAGEPFYELDAAVARVGDPSDLTFLDVGCATARFSFHLILGGARAVRGVEIRRAHIDQANLLREADERLRENAALRLDHVPTSADERGFLVGEQYDVVLSFGVLTQLMDPLTHLANLRRLARRAVVLRTATHRVASGTWLLERVDASWMTKGTSGTSWTPYYGDVSRLLLQAGFRSVEVIVHPLVERFQRPLLKRAGDSPPRGLPARLLRKVRHDLVRERVNRAETRARDALLRSYQSSAYFTYVAHA